MLKSNIKINVVLSKEYEVSPKKIAKIFVN
jgi:hypothetical protein